MVFSALGFDYHFAQNAGLPDTVYRKQVSGSPDPAFPHRPMRISTSSRRISILTAMGMLLLACAVFAWGLQYKMSLYGPVNGISHSTPEAKLLSEKERPASQQEKASIRPAFPQPQTTMLPALLLIAAVAICLPHSATLWMRTASMQVALIQHRRAHLNYFSFRPPPDSLSFN